MLKSSKINRHISASLAGRLGGFALALSALFVPHELAAQEAIPEIVVSATGISTPSAQIGASVSVVSRQDLQDAQVVHLQDALSHLKGVYFRQTGGIGGLTSLQMRGLTRQNIVVLIDGNNMADAADANGGAEIANVMVADIERIEVFRGANSVLFGSNAVAGVINIITRQPGSAEEVEVSMKTGSHNRLELSGQVIGRSENDRVGYRLTVATLDAAFASELDEENTHYGEREDYKNTTVSGAVNVKLTELTSLSFLARAVHASADTDGTTGSPNWAVVDGHYGTNTDQNLLTAGFETQVSENLIVEGNYSFFGNYRDSYAEQGETYWYDGERETIDARAVYFMSDDTYVNFGLESKIEKLLQNGLASEKQVDTESLFGVLHHAVGNLSTNLGVRLDDHEKFGSQTSWRVGAVYAITPHIASTLNVGTAYRAPSLYELFGEDASCTDGLCGNEDLSPEESDSYDVGLRVALATMPVSFEVNYFDIRTENRIYYKSVGPPTWLGNFQNDSGESTSTGTEASLHAALSKQLDLRLSAAKINPRTATKAIQNQQARRTISAQLSYRLNDGKSRLGLSAFRASDRFVSGQSQEDYLVVDATYSRVLSDTWTLEAKINNLFDEHYRVDKAKSTPRSSGTIGLRGRF
jgi:vitamin B12 transporter